MELRTLYLSENHLFSAREKRLVFESIPEKQAKQFKKKVADKRLEAGSVVELPSQVQAALAASPDPAPAVGAAPEVDPGVDSSKEKAAAERDEKKESKIEMSKLDMAILKDRVEEERVMHRMKDKRWELSALRRSSNLDHEKPNIDALAWNPTNGIEGIKADWEALDIYRNEPFFRALFYQLGRCSDETFLAGNKFEDIYRDPLNNMDKLDQLNDPLFEKAVRFFVSVKDIVVQQDYLQKNYEDGKSNESQDIVGSKITDFLKSNVNALTEALRNGDYATAGVYAGGVYALYRLWNSWGEPKDGKPGLKAFIKKGLMITAVLYVGNKMAKNAGYDIPGLSTMFDKRRSLHDTPLISFYRVRNSNVQKLMSGVSHDTVSDLAFVNVKSLYTAYKNQPNADGIHFIDPAPFFPEFSNLYPDDKFFTNAPLSVEERKYKEKGEELYKFMKAMTTTYEVVMMPGRDKTFEQALKDPVLAGSAVIDFAMELSAKTSRAHEGLYKPGFEKIMGSRLEEVFKEIKISSKIDMGIEFGGAKGTIMGLPIVAQQNNTTNTYKIFDRYTFDQAGGNPDEASALGEIPVEGPAEPQALALQGEIEKFVPSQFDDYLTRKSPGVTFVNRPTYNLQNGRWEIKYKLEGKALSASAAGEPEILAFVVPGSPERPMHIVSSKDIREASLFEGGLETDMGRMALEALVKQNGSGGAPNFTLLQYFRAHGALHFEDSNIADDTFDLRIGNIGTYTVRFDGSQYTFVVPSGSPDPQEEILKNPAFRQALEGYVEEDESFREIFNNIDTLLANADEDFFKHFIDGVPGWFKEFTLAKPARGFHSDQIGGAIAEGYVLGLWQAQKQLILAHAFTNLQNNKTLDDATKQINAVIPRAKHKLERLNKIFIQKSDQLELKGQDWTREEFEKTFLRDMTEIGTNSTVYTGWYRRFANTLLALGVDDDQIPDYLATFSHYTSEDDLALLDGVELSNSSHPNTIEFKKSAKHADYVASSLLEWRRLNPNAKSGPTPSDLSLLSRSTFNPSTYLNYSFEFAETEVLAPNSAYVEFDVYINTVNNLPTQADRDIYRASIPDDRLILPRKKTTFELRDMSEVRRFYDLTGLRALPKGKEEIKPKNVPLTEIESTFLEYIDKAFEDLKGLGTPTPNFFQTWNEFKPMYELEVSKMPGSGAPVFEVEMTPGRLGSYKGKTGFEERSTRMSMLMQSLMTRFTAGTQTKSYQEDIIKDFVGEWVDGHILRPNKIDLYFQKPNTVSGLRLSWKRLRHKFHKIF